MEHDTQLTPEQAQQFQFEQTERGVMVIWTITWNTSDYPRKAVARPHLVGGETLGPVAQYAMLLADSLDQLREQLPAGLTKMARDPNDDPVIIEVWL
jgi:phage terminase Nu1 subunit (DNA packaging protein)